jgi:hypothetical protein
MNVSSGGNEQAHSEPVHNPVTQLFHAGYSGVLGNNRSAVRPAPVVVCCSEARPTDRAPAPARNRRGRPKMYREFALSIRSSRCVHSEAPDSVHSWLHQSFLNRGANEPYRGVLTELPHNRAFLGAYGMDRAAQGLGHERELSLLNQQRQNLSLSGAQLDHRVLPSGPAIRIVGVSYHSAFPSGEAAYLDLQLSPSTDKHADFFQFLTLFEKLIFIG